MCNRLISGADKRLDAFMSSPRLATCYKPKFQSFSFWNFRAMDVDEPVVDNDIVFDGEVINRKPTNIPIGILAEILAFNVPVDKFLVLNPMYKNRRSGKNLLIENLLGGNFDFMYD